MGGWVAREVPGSELGSRGRPNFGFAYGNGETDPEFYKMGGNKMFGSATPPTRFDSVKCNSARCGSA